VLRRPLVHVWAGPPVDLSRWAGKPLDVGVLAEATEAILAAITELLEEIRGEHAREERWNPRSHGQALTGDFKRPRSGEQGGGR
jgi:hypothetical protein